MTHSTAGAIRGFFERLKPQKSTTVAKVIADSLEVKEDSFELYLLLEIQRDNFSRLLTQIELSNAGTRAKQTSTRQIQKLGKFVRYNTMQQVFETVRAELIAPNLEALTYAEEFLGIAHQPENTLADDIREVSKHLEAALKEIRESSLPSLMRANLDKQISRLIFLLHNHEVTSADQIWEATSAALVTVHRDLPSVSKESDSKVVGGLGKILSHLLVIVAALSFGAQQLEKTTEHADKALEHIENIGGRLKRGYEQIEKMVKPRVPQLEDHSKKNQKPDEPLVET